MVRRRLHLYESWLCLSEDVVEFGANSHVYELSEFQPLTSEMKNIIYGEISVVASFSLIFLFIFFSNLALNHFS